MAQVSSAKKFRHRTQTLCCEVIACDSYANAPAMQVADRAHVFSMLDGTELRRVIELEQPDFVVPEVEAIATATLLELECEGVNVVPSAQPLTSTMNREGIRRLVAEELDIPTSDYRFAADETEFKEAVQAIGFPCFVKPIMSSSGEASLWSNLVLRSMLHGNMPSVVVAPVKVKSS